MKRYLLIAVVLVFGILLRWYGINWALPLVFHPDETRLLYAVGEISWENLNPRFFAYGSLPIYLLKIVHSSAEALAGWFGKPPHVNFFLVGRAVSAFFGSLTLFVLYLFGKRFFSGRVALLSTTFLAFTVLHIQLSHFLTVDVMLTFFVLLALYVMAALLEGRQLLRNYLFSGILIGLALATKMSALPLYGVFFVAHIFVLFNRRKTPGSEPDPSSRRSKLHPSLFLWEIFLLALFISGLTFFLGEPYAFFEFKEFYRQVKEQSDMVRGITQPPFVIQYEQTTPYVYQLKQLIVYSMGIPLGLLTLFGTFFVLIETCKKIISNFPSRIRQFTSCCSQLVPRNSQPIFLILCWVIPVFWVVGGFKVKFLRYMLPLIPFFCLFGAVFVERLLQRVPSWKPVIYVIVTGTIAFSVFYSAAFVSVYQREDPRVEASRWIYEHVEEGSTLLTEAWEFAPIVPVDGFRPQQYRLLELDLYGPDFEPKIRKIADQLSETDIIVMATRRLYGSILRMPKQHPLTTSYYKLLFDGTLGFHPVKTFTLYPSLFGMTFNDDFADESFSVYEHPKTILFQKTKEISADDLYTMILAAPPVEATGQLLERLLAFPALERDYRPLEGEPPPRPLLSPPISGEETGWLFTGFYQWRTIGIWFITVELLAFIAFPLSGLTFRNLPDAGYAVSKVVGILLPSYLVWLLVSLKLIAFSWKSLLITADILFIAALLIILRELPFFVELLRAKWRIFLIYECVFLLAFGAFILFRAYNPDIFWSESSMDFSFLNVLVRTRALPPPDPWFSGSSLNYYYFGHFLVAVLTKLTGIPPQITYNLAFALFPALVIIEVFSVIFNLTKRYLWGIAGVLFSAIIGNLDGFFLLVAAWRVKSPLVQRLDMLLRHFAVSRGLENWYGFFDMLIGEEHYYRLFRCAHEVIPYTVHEFPFWTFIFVDLHAHLLNMPFLIAAFLVGLNLLSEDLAGETQNLRVSSSSFLIPLSLFLYTLLVGTLGVISSWDYPTALIFLFLITLVQAYKKLRGVPNLPGRLSPLILYILIVGVLSVLKQQGYVLSLFERISVRFSPAVIPVLEEIYRWFYRIVLLFSIPVLVKTYRNFKDVSNFLSRIRSLLTLICIIIPGSILFYIPFYTSFSRSGMGIDFVGKSTTLLANFLTIFGFFFFLVFSYFFIQAFRFRSYTYPWWVFISLLAATVMIHLIALYYFNYAWGTLLFVLFTMLFGTYIFTSDFHSQHSSFEHIYVWLCLIYACMIIAGCEVIFVRDFLQGGEYKRMNTIFKFYIPAWYLFSFVGTYAFFQIITFFKRQQFQKRLTTAYSQLPAVLWLVGFGILFLFSAVFPVMGTYARRHRQDLYPRMYLPLTLDGLAYLSVRHPDELLAIRWLNEHVAGTPVILEASGADYLYEYARISANTGLPTILGWKSHADQREHWDYTHQRVLDVKTIYTSLNINQVLFLLRHYHVEYIYVGRTERRDFTEKQLQKFQDHPEYFEPVFQSGETVIYRVTYD